MKPVSRRTDAGLAVSSAERWCELEIVIRAHGDFERVLMPQRNASHLRLLVAFLSFLSFAFLSLLAFFALLTLLFSFTLLAGLILRLLLLLVVIGARGGRNRVHGAASSVGSS